LCNGLSLEVIFLEAETAVYRYDLFEMWFEEFFEKGNVRVRKKANLPSKYD